MKKLFDAYNYLLECEDTERFQKIFTRYEFFKKTLSVPGDIIECGVFKGTGHIFWLKLLKIYDQHSKKKVIGFDTFINFPKSTLKFEKKNAKKFLKESNFKPISVRKINEKIKKLNMLNRSELVKGDVVKTSKQYVKKNRGFKISLLNIDLDTYQGTKHALENFYPFMARESIILLDEYGKRGWGETEAVDEFLKNKKNLRIKSIKFSSQPTAYIEIK